MISLLAAVIGCPARAGELKPVVRPDETYKELARDAERWKKAVLGRSTDVLVQFVLPEAREHVGRELRDQESLLFKDLFSSTTSVHELFSRGSRIETVLVPDPQLEKLGHGTSVCYFDRQLVTPVWPMSREEFFKFSKSSSSFCLFASYDDGRWYFSYSFAESEDGA